MPASEARGRNWLPGRITARRSVTGMSSSDTTRVVGSPITSAGDIPMLRPSAPLNLRAMRLRVASEMGFRPSMKSTVTRGISSITAPILMPSVRIWGMLSTIWPHDVHVRQPMPMPTTTPRKRGSPITPNFFFMPSASISILLRPGIMSRPLLMIQAKGANPAQNGCGMDMPSISL